MEVLVGVDDLLDVLVAVVLSVAEAEVVAPLVDAVAEDVDVAVDDAVAVDVPVAVAVGVAVEVAVGELELSSANSCVPISVSNQTTY